MFGIDPYFLSFEFGSIFFLAMTALGILAVLLSGIMDSITEIFGLDD